MNSGNRKKSLQLGMSFGKANSRLKKKIMFRLIQEANRDNCYRCGEKILHIDNFSIEHIKHWLDSENPEELFFDLDNIAFSHLNCNISCSRYNLDVKKITGMNNGKSKIGPDGTAWCGNCKRFLPVEFFTKNKRTRNNCEWVCRECRSQVRAAKKLPIQEEWCNGNIPISKIE